MDCAIDTATTKQRRIGGIDNRIDRQLGDICLDRSQNDRRLRAGVL